jgi:Holliday junction resolvase RusA-like endonuclease
MPTRTEILAALSPSARAAVARQLGQSVPTPAPSGGETALTLPYPPSTNNLYATVRGRRVLTREGRQYKERAAALAVAHGMKPVDGEVSVTLRLYRPRRAGDIDNSLKSVFDSLKGVAWRDDSQVKRIEAERFEDKANPRVEIVVEPISRLVFQEPDA